MNDALSEQASWDEPTSSLPEPDPELVIREAMETFTVRLPNELAVQIQHAAVDDERTWSWMARRLIEDGLRARGVTPFRAKGLHLD